MKETAQHSTAQHGAARHSTAGHGRARHHTALRCADELAELSCVCFILPWYLVLSYDTWYVRNRKHSTARHSTAQHGSARQRTAAHGSALLS